MGILLAITLFGCEREASKNVDQFKDGSALISAPPTDLQNEGNNVQGKQVVDKDDITNTPLWTSEVGAVVGDIISLDLTITSTSLRDKAYGAPRMCTDAPFIVGPKGYEVMLNFDSQNSLNADSVNMAHLLVTGGNNKDEYWKSIPFPISPDRSDDLDKSDSLNRILSQSGTVRDRKLTYSYSHFVTLDGTYKVMVYNDCSETGGAALPISPTAPEYSISVKSLWNTYVTYIVR